MARGPFMSRRWAAFLLVAGVALGVWACGPGTNGPKPPDTPRLPQEAEGPPLFEDVTDRSGLKHTYGNGEEAGHLAILESLGGGVGVLDYNGDGLPDLFLP